MIKMYMLVSGASMLVHEEQLDQGKIWEYPLIVVAIPPQHPGSKPTLHFNMMNNNLLTNSQKAISPNTNLILYEMTPTKMLLTSYEEVIADLKMKLSGLVIPSNSKIITP